MKATRRGFFGALFGAALARKVPKPKFESYSFSVTQYSDYISLSSDLGMADGAIITEAARQLGYRAGLYVDDVMDDVIRNEHTSPDV